METGMSFEPRFHLGMFVRGVVVHDEVQVQSGGCLGIDLTQETQKLLVPMARQAGANDLAVERAQRREQRSCAVTFVVVGLSAVAALAQRQPRLRAIQCLDLAFSSTHKTRARSGGAR